MGNRRRGLIKAVVHKERPDILVVQEIKRQGVDRSFMASIWKSRFVEWLLLLVVGRSRGILVV